VKNENEPKAFKTRISSLNRETHEQQTNWLS